MRKWHRWLSVLFGLFILFIATTGVLSQVGSLINDSKMEAARAAAGPEAAAEPEGFVCPETMTCRPKRPEIEGGWDVGFLHHIHSGEEFGPIGVAISILSGLALIFFAFSGLWLYVQMYRGRIVKVRDGKSVRGGRFFWE